LAKANIEAFENAKVDYVCVNAAGCGAMMKDYGHLLSRDPEWKERAAALSSRVRDVSELLSAAGPARIGGGVPVRVAYDAPCHLVHGQRVSAPPLDVLRAIPELQAGAAERKRGVLRERGNLQSRRAGDVGHRHEAEAREHRRLEGRGHRDGQSRAA
jgi:Fe-S oxidoreductase